MRILFIGDINSSKGRRIVRERLTELKEQHSIDFTIANVDNAAHGLGCTPKIARQLHELGIDVLTGGNHVFDRKDMESELPDMPFLLRAANYPGPVPGQAVFLGECAGRPLLVATFIGQTFMGNYDNPFHGCDRLIDEHGVAGQIRIIDFHAEATSEKVALGRHLDGRATAVIGTHTHVQTADQQVLPGGTGYITDVGMTGPHDGVIGMHTDTVLPRFLNGMPTRFEPAEGDVKLHAVVLDVDDATAKCRDIQRISQIESQT